MPWVERASFFVPGSPATKGSPWPAKHPRTGKLFLAPDSEHLKRWVELVQLCALPHRLSPPLGGAISLGLVFSLRRPRNQLHSDGRIRKTAPLWPTVDPDLDKLARAIGDAISGRRDKGKERVGLLLVRDSQIVNYHVLQKRYALAEEAEGCRITVRQYEPRRED